MLGGSQPARSPCPPILGNWGLRGGPPGPPGSSSVLARWSFPEQQEEELCASGFEQRVEVGAQVPSSQVHGFSMSVEQVYFGLFPPALSLVWPTGGATSQPCCSSWVQGAVKQS